MTELRDAVTAHEPDETPNWDTKITCVCGERCSNWMAFYRHRGDEYAARLAEAEADAAWWKAIAKSRDPWRVARREAP